MQFGQSPAGHGPGVGMGLAAGQHQEWTLANMCSLDRHSVLVILASWLSPSRGQAEPTITNQK